MMQKPKKWLKPCNMGTHLRVLSESFQMNTNMTVFRWFSKEIKNIFVLALGMKEASALEGLSTQELHVHTALFATVKVYFL